MSSTGTAFSSSEDVIQRKLDFESQTATQDENLVEIYEIKQCIDWLLKNGSTCVALQFPDELLVDAPKIAYVIQLALPNTHVFILGDTSYGSCCVDEVGAQHYNADCIIHYGHACLSPTSRLPVFYVFGKSHIDIEDCVSKISQADTEKDRKMVVVYDTAYAHIIDKLYKELVNHLPHLNLSKLQLPAIASTNIFSDKNSESLLRLECTECSQNSLTNSGTDKLHSLIQKCGRTIHFTQDTDINECSFLFIGGCESATVISLMMTFNKCPFFIYDPQNQIFQRTGMNINKALMKRYYLVERAKDANIVGIVVGTLGVLQYKEIIERMKILIKKAGKKSYTFVTGKLNPAKLANFAEVDIYVLVSCLESGLLEQKDFYRPVVTPFEMELACNKAREWNGEYTTEFASLLPGSYMYVEAPADSEYTCEGDVSLISNRIRILGQKETPELSEKRTKDVALRSDSTALAGVSENAGEFFSTRSWRGLEKQLGETPVSKASEGQSGISVSYQNEHPHSSNEIKH